MKNRQNPDYVNATHAFVILDKSGKALPVKGNEALYKMLTGRPHEPRFVFTKNGFREVFPEKRMKFFRPLPDPCPIRFEVAGKKVKKSVDSPG